MASIFGITNTIKIQDIDLQAALECALRDPLKNAFIISNFTQLKQDCSIVFNTGDGINYSAASYYMDLPFFNINFMVYTTTDIKCLVGKLLAQHPELKGQPIFGLYDEATTRLLEQCFQVTRKNQQYKMALKLDQIPEQPYDQTRYRLERMTLDDIVRISQLYTLVPSMAWTPKMLQFGPYYGTFCEEHLVSIAGVQFVTKWVTEIGNIVTHFKHRRQNLAFACTRAVAESLRKSSERIFLCVYADNESAIRLYEKMGFVTAETINLIQFFI